MLSILHHVYRTSYKDQQNCNTEMFFVPVPRSESECILVKPKVQCYTSACLIVTLLKSLTVITYMVIQFVEVKLGWFK